MDQADRIAALERRVRELSDVVLHIPMTAVALRLVPLESCGDALRDPSMAMSILEQIAGMAETYKTLEEHLGKPDATIQLMVARRRANLEQTPEWRAFRQRPQPFGS